jgi:Fur family ferric uptake transcriptional regulator
MQLICINNSYFAVMEYSALKKILKNHSLRVTDCRMDVLQHFIQTEHALSTRELEERFSQYDRVTLYRTLSSFTEKGVLHHIPDDSGFARYGICHETCTPESHDHNHIHFKCTSCGELSCIPGFAVPEISIPGYQVFDKNLILTGLCQTCNQTNR